jgi:multiple sugar transport system permease protein
MSTLDSARRQVEETASTAGQGDSIPPPRQRRSRNPFERGRGRLASQLLVGPLGFSSLVILPAFIYNVYISLFDYKLTGGREGEFIGLDNYVRMFTDPTWLDTIGRTLIFVVFTVFLEIILGFTAALILYRHFNDLKWLQTIVLLPMMISEVAAALAFKHLLGTDGSLLNWFIGLFGISPQQWLGTTWALPTVIVIDVWIHTPFVILVLFAAMQGMPKELLETAEVDGATLLQQVRNVIIPLVMPSILVVLIFRTVFAFRVFTTIWLLTGGGPANRTSVLGIEIYNYGFSYYDTSFSAALSVVLLAISLAIALGYMRLLDRESLS